MCRSRAGSSRRARYVDVREVETAGTGCLTDRARSCLAGFQFLARTKPRACPAGELPAWTGLPGALGAFIRSTHFWIDCRCVNARRLPEGGQVPGPYPLDRDLQRVERKATPSRMRSISLSVRGQRKIVGACSPAGRQALSSRSAFAALALAVALALSAVSVTEAKNCRTLPSRYSANRIRPARSWHAFGMETWLPRHGPARRKGCGVSGKARIRWARERTPWRRTTLGSVPRCKLRDSEFADRRAPPKNRSRSITAIMYPGSKRADSVRAVDWKCRGNVAELM